MALTVRSLHVYPVKSLRGIDLAEARVERRGIHLDRRWMLVDENGRFVSQREEARLALVDVAVEDFAERLVVRAPGTGEIAIPFRPRGGRRRVEIWRDTCDAVSVDDAVAAFFTRFLGRPCDLVYMPDDVERAVDRRYAREGDLVGFADGYPLLLTTEASLDALNARLDAPVPMARFRPNVVLAGAAPFAEDTWRALRIGELPFRAPKPCARCTIPTIDIATAAKAKEPLATLAAFRNFEAGVLFGQNLVHDRDGVLRVGDTAEVLAMGDPPPI